MHASLPPCHGARGVNAQRVCMHGRGNYGAPGLSPDPWVLYGQPLRVFVAGLWLNLHDGCRCHTATSTHNVGRCCLPPISLSARRCAALLHVTADHDARSCSCGALAAQFGQTPLHVAALNGHTEAVQALLVKGANIEAPTKVRCCTNPARRHSRRSMHRAACMQACHHAMVHVAFMPERVYTWAW